MSNKLKFYKFFFKNKPKPVVMEAFSLEEAELMLNELNKKVEAKIVIDDIEDVRIEMPIIGVSTKKRRGVKYVWVGLRNSTNGWKKAE